MWGRTATRRRGWGEDTSRGATTDAACPHVPASSVPPVHDPAPPPPAPPAGASCSAGVPGGPCKCGVLARIGRGIPDPGGTTRLSTSLMTTARMVGWIGFRSELNERPRARQCVTGSWDLVSLFIRSRSFWMVVSVATADRNGSRSLVLIDSSHPLIDRPTDRATMHVGLLPDKSPRNPVMHAPDQTRPKKKKTVRYLHILTCTSSFWGGS
jgi:hypothetical protein